MPLWRRTWKSVREFMEDEDGPTAVEYAVMLAFIIGVCIASVNQFATNLDDNIQRSSDAIDSALN